MMWENGPEIVRCVTGVIRTGKTGAANIVVPTAYVFFFIATRVSATTLFIYYQVLLVNPPRLAIESCGYVLKILGDRDNL
jgi:hypothetical protein